MPCVVTTAASTEQLRNQHQSQRMVSLTNQSSKGGASPVCQKRQDQGRGVATSASRRPDTRRGHAMSAGGGESLPHDTWTHRSTMSATVADVDSAWRVAAAGDIGWSTRGACGPERQSLVVSEKKYSWNGNNFGQCRHFSPGSGCRICTVI